MSEYKWLEDELSYQDDLGICEEIVKNFHKVGNVREDKHKIVVFDLSTLLHVATRQIFDGLAKVTEEIGNIFTRKFWKKFKK